MVLTRVDIDWVGVETALYGPLDGPRTLSEAAGRNAFRALIRMGRPKPVLTLLSASRRREPPDGDPIEAAIMSLSSVQSP